MGKVWVLDTETKGTGARMVPLEDALAKPEPDSKPVRREERPRPADPGARRRPAPRGPVERTSTPLPAGHVRKKATGEIGRVRAVDARAGTATVLWLKQGRTSTVRLSEITRR
jgi:hypothetical protein